MYELSYDKLEILEERFVARTGGHHYLTFWFWPCQVIHPIHDQTIYLSEQHKRRLKEEFGNLFMF